MGNKTFTLQIVLYDFLKTYKYGSIQTEDIIDSTLLQSVIFEQSNNLSDIFIRILGNQNAKKTYGKFIFVFNVYEQFYNCKMFIRQVSSSTYQVRLRPSIVDNDNLETWTKLVKKIDDFDYNQRSYIYQLHNGADSDIVITDMLYQNEVYNDDKGSLVLRLKDRLPIQHKENRNCTIYKTYKDKGILENPYLQTTFEKYQLPDIKEPIELNPAIITSNESDETIDTQDNYFSLSQIQENLNTIGFVNLSDKKVQVDYSKFQNFVIYGSAYQMANNLKRKIQQNQVIDEPFRKRCNYYQQYLLDTLYSSEQYQLEQYNYLQSARLYDQQNIHSLINYIPDFIKNESLNQQFIRFINLVGIFLDQILLYIQHFIDVIPLAGVSQNDQSIRQILLTKLNSVGFSKGQLISNSKILSRIYNNIPQIYNSRGSIKSIDLIFNCFGLDLTYDFIYPTNQTQIQTDLPSNRLYPATNIKIENTINDRVIMYFNQFDHTKQLQQQIIQDKGLDSIYSMIYDSYQIDNYDLLYNQYINSTFQTQLKNIQNTQITSAIKILAQIIQHNIISNIITLQYNMIIRNHIMKQNKSKLCKTPKVNLISEKNIKINILNDIYTNIYNMNKTQIIDDSTIDCLYNVLRDIQIDKKDKVDCDLYTMSNVQIEDTKPIQTKGILQFIDVNYDKSFNGRGFNNATLYGSITIFKPKKFKSNSNKLTVSHTDLTTNIIK